MKFSTNYHYCLSLISCTEGEGEEEVVEEEEEEEEEEEGEEEEKIAN